MSDREIDKLIHTKIMGYPGRIAYRFTEDISLAWQVVEKLADLGFDVIVSRVLDWRDKYECCLVKENWRDDDRICKGADTAPMAICLAAAETIEATQKEKTL